MQPRSPSYHLGRKPIQACSVILTVCFFLFLLGSAHAAKDPGKIKLTKLKRLTLRSGQMTTGRRGSPVPQLSCVGGDAKGKYEVDVMVCNNLGSDYGDDDVSWSCTADVPGYFRLGSTDVICEGYDHPEDPYVLRGSCGVEYRLQLTNLGHEKFGNPMSISEGIYQLGSNVASILAVGLALLCVAVALRACLGGSPTRGGGGGGSGGGGGGRGMDDPPPPYPGSGPRKVYSSSTSSTGEGWRPGFWTGAATGAAASHILNRGRDERRGMGDPMAGPSRSGGAGDSPASRPSTGFGQTRRR